MRLGPGDRTNRYGGKGCLIETILLGAKSRITNQESCKDQEAEVGVGDAQVARLGPDPGGVPVSPV